MNRAPIKRHKFTVILEEESDGGYSVYCPALPGCVSQGDDRNSAMENVKEAIELALEVTEGRQQLTDSPALIANEIRELLEGREQDGLPYAGVFLEQVEITAKATSFQEAVN